MGEVRKRSEVVEGGGRRRCRRTKGRIIYTANTVFFSTGENDEEEDS